MRMKLHTLPRTALLTLALSAIATLTACHPVAAPNPNGGAPVAHEDAFGNVSYTNERGGVEYIGSKRP